MGGVRGSISGLGTLFGLYLVVIGVAWEYYAGIMFGVVLLVILLGRHLYLEHVSGSPIAG